MTPHIGAGITNKASELSFLISLFIDFSEAVQVLDQKNKKNLVPDGFYPNIFKLGEFSC